MNNQAELLQNVLKPLLDDFLYWFDRAKTLLSDHDMPTLSVSEQADLLARVAQAHGEVLAAQTLFTSMGGQAGVEMAVVNQWHQLVAECWTVSLAYRRAQASASGESPSSTPDSSSEGSATA